MLWKEFLASSFLRDIPIPLVIHYTHSLSFFLRYFTITCLQFLVNASRFKFLIWENFQFLIWVNSKLSKMRDFLVRRVFPLLCHLRFTIRFSFIPLPLYWFIVMYLLTHVVICWIWLEINLWCTDTVHMYWICLRELSRHLRSHRRTFMLMPMMHISNV